MKRFPTWVNVLKWQLIYFVAGEMKSWVSTISLVLPFFQKPSSFLSNWGFFLTVTIFRLNPVVKSIEWKRTRLLKSFPAWVNFLKWQLIYFVAGQMNSWVSWRMSTKGNFLLKAICFGFLLMENQIQPQKELCCCFPCKFM